MNLSPQLARAARRIDNPDSDRGDCGGFLRPLNSQYSTRFPTVNLT